MVAPRPGEPFEPAAVGAVVPWWRDVAEAPAEGWPAWPPLAPEPTPAPATSATRDDLDLAGER
jgi:hypothetical protein